MINYLCRSWPLGIALLFVGTTFATISLSPAQTANDPAAVQPVKADGPQSARKTSASSSRS